MAMGHKWERSCYGVGALIVAGFPKTSVRWAVACALFCTGNSQRKL